MQIHDIDWRSVLNSWEVADLLYLRSIIDEKIAMSQKRRIIIRKQ
jgi:hypothetical protein